MLKKIMKISNYYFTDVQFLKVFDSFLAICKNTYVLMLFEYTNKEFMSRSVPDDKICY